MQQRDLARYLLRHRIVALIVGQHVHVVQPIERIGRRFVVFGETTCSRTRPPLAAPRSRRTA
jgi:poly-gamma-glutamate capsule biosynthesis protein CapA/YwtB (metallophosphatase superfamily)